MALPCAMVSLPGEISNHIAKWLPAAVLPFPDQHGRRFSRNAASPSCASAAKAFFVMTCDERRTLYWRSPMGGANSPRDFPSRTTPPGHSSNTGARSAEDQRVLLGSGRVGNQVNSLTIHLE